MDFTQLRNNVEEIASALGHHDDLTEQQKDNLEPVLVEKAILTFGQTFISIAESLHDIAKIQRERPNPGRSELKPLPSTFERAAE